MNKRWTTVPIALAMLLLHACTTAPTTAPSTPSGPPQTDTPSPTAPTSTPTKVPPPTRPPGATKTPLPSPGPAPGPFPTGTFTTQVPGAMFEIEFRDDGTMKVTRNIIGFGTDVFPGSYTVVGDQVEFLTSGVCAETIEGLYTWSFDGTILDFVELFDQCGDRTTVLTGGLTLRQDS